MDRRLLEWSWVDRPGSALDVFGRYLLGVRRFTEAHVQAVERYLFSSWGVDLLDWWPTALLEHFADREKRRSKDRFTRTMPAFYDRRTRTTWRATASGLYVIDDGTASDWADLPALGWPPLLVLWVTGGDSAQERRERFDGLADFCTDELMGYRRLLVANGVLTTSDIVAIAATFAFTELADASDASRDGTVRAQLRWLREAGLVASRTRRKPKQLTEPFQYVDLWGWEQLREQIVRTTYMSAAAQAELTGGELFRQLVEAAAGRYRSDIWVPKRVDFGNLAFNRAYQITQQLIDNLLDRFPRRWRGCAQEFRVSAEFHPRGHPRLEGIPLAPDLPATQDRETSHRQIDGVLWQAEDPWPYPSMLIELDIERTASVRNHLIAACHVANHSDRPVTLLYVAGYKAMAHVRRTIYSEFYGNQLADTVLCQGAKLRLRLVGLKAALATTPLECPHVIDETFTRTRRY